MTEPVSEHSQHQHISAVNAAWLAWTTNYNPDRFDELLNVLDASFGRTTPREPNLPVVQHARAYLPLILRHHIEAKLDWYAWRITKMSKLLFRENHWAHLMQQDVPRYDLAVFLLEWSAKAKFMHTAGYAAQLSSIQSALAGLVGHPVTLKLETLTRDMATILFGDTWSTLYESDIANGFHGNYDCVLRDRPPFSWETRYPGKSSPETTPLPNELAL